MKIIICLLLVASAVFGFVNLNAPKIKPSDFKRLNGEQWKGKLTYQDYRSNKKVSILSNLTVTESKEDKLSWTFEYEYPDEPKANQKSIVKISKDGKTFDDGTCDAPLKGHQLYSRGKIVKCETFSSFILQVP